MLTGCFLSSASSSLQLRPQLWDLVALVPHLHQLSALTTSSPSPFNLNSYRYAWGFWLDYFLRLKLSDTPAIGFRGCFLTNSEPSKFCRSNLGPNPSFLPTSQPATCMQPANPFSNFTQTQTACQPATTLPACQPATALRTSNPSSVSTYSQTQPGYQHVIPSQTSSIFPVLSQTSSPFNLGQIQPASSTGLPAATVQMSSIFSFPTQTSSAFNLNQTDPASSNGLIAVPAQTSSNFFVPTQTTSAFNVSRTQPAFSNGFIALPAQTSSAFSFFKETPSVLSLSPIQPASSTGLPTVPTQTTSVFPVLTQTSSAFKLNQTQPAFSTYTGGTSGIPSQGSIAQHFSYQSNVAMQPVPISDPFGALPSLHQLSLGPVQHGISSMPVTQKAALIRTSPLSAPRHLNQRRINLPVRKYKPKMDGPKVPFFMDDEERKTPSMVFQFVIPRENPRSLVAGSIKQWPPEARPEKQDMSKNTDYPINENAIPRPPSPSKSTATVYGHNDDIEALMPKLHHADYYIEPQIQELAAKERARPGFCRRVKDFVVGRHGYGSIKFYGETDVRGLDIESIIQFNDREVIVHIDGSKKPPTGQGLNKAAEITLLNVKCIKNGQHCTEGRMVEKYKDTLMKKAEEQGAEFVSFDAAKGLWKFKVEHF